MNPDTTPYQLATLAARIAPQLCADLSKQNRAVTLALSLIGESDHILNQRMVRNKKEKETDDREKAFRQLYDLMGGHIEYSYAAKVITGHVEDRHRSEAVGKFEKLVMEHEDPFEPDVKARLAQNADMLSRYRTSGVPVHDVINWRLFAEHSGICAKKLLTRELRAVPQNLQEVSENNAAGAPKVAKIGSKSAAKPSKKRGRGR